MSEHIKKLAEQAGMEWDTHIWCWLANPPHLERFAELVRQELAKPEQEPKLTDAGVDTNIPLWGLEPKGSGMVTLHEPEQDWSLLKATQKSLREHQARIKELEAQLAPQVCCGDYEKCWKPCTSRGRWLANQQMTRLGQEKGQFVGGMPDVSQQRQWVGLTSEDWENTPDTGKQGCERDAELFDWIEQTLKDKNEPSR